MSKSEKSSPRSGTRRSPQTQIELENKSKSKSTPHKNIEVITPEDLPELTRKEAKVNREFIVDYADHKYRIKVEGNKILFMDNYKTEIPCITIEVKTHQVDLSYYYLRRNIRKDCPPLDHKLFFKFLRKLGEVYDRPVTLLDLSSQNLENTDCIIEGTIFSLAGKPTFYERFGFRNQTYTDQIKRLQTMTVEEFMDLPQPVRRSYRLDKTFQKVKRAIESFGMSMSTTVKKMATFLVEECKSKEVYNKEFVRRGYNAWNSTDRPMVRTRKYKRPEQSTGNHAMILRWLTNRLSSSIELDSYFTME